jgi:SET domain
MLVKPIQYKGELNPDVLEPVFSSMEQVECPVVHHFGPGIYVREVTIPTGAVAMGHKQRFDHLNIVLKGSVAVIDDFGGVKVISAPTIFVGKAGRKVGYCIEECVWQNVYANPDDERDIETLEARYLDKSEFSKEFDRITVEEEAALHDDDREDFALMLEELGVSAEQVREESQRSDDLVPVPDEFASRLSIRPSPIEGRGLFLSFGAKEGEVIAPAQIDARRTIAGKYVNHAKNPNCRYERHGNGVIYLVAARDIHGCIGGSPGEELTADYRQAARLSGRVK